MSLEARCQAVNGWWNMNWQHSKQKQRRNAMTDSGLGTELNVTYTETDTSNACCI
jgi:hypothetical protein